MFALDGKKQFKGPYDCVRSMYGSHGIKGCFKGLSTTIFRDFIGFGVYILTYEIICDYGTPKGERTSIGMNLLAGGLSGVFSWIANVPIDNVKSRIQADDLRLPLYKNTWECVVVNFKRGGFKVFWKGLPITCLRAFPVNAITFVVYSQSISLIDRL